MKRLTKKIKGKQYARPFIVNDGYFWAIQNIHLSNMDFHESMRDMQNRIYTALQVPASSIGDEIVKLGEAGMAGARAAEAFKIQLNKMKHENINNRAKG